MSKDEAAFYSSWDSQCPVWSLKYRLNQGMSKPETKEGGECLGSSYPGAQCVPSR